MYPVYKALKNGNKYMCYRSCFRVSVGTKFNNIEKNRKIERKLAE